MAGYVVQTAQGTATSSPGTVTLPSATRTGNTLIALASVRNAGASNGTLTAVTLAGAADNFAQAYSVASPTGAPQLYWWLDPLCEGGQTKVVFTTTGGAGAEALTMDVLEVGGMLPIPAGPGAVDTALTVTGTAASWNTGTTTVGWPTAVQVGMLGASGTHPASQYTGSPWISLTSQPNGTTSLTQVNYQLNSAGGQTNFLTYNGTITASEPFTAGVVSFPAMTFSPNLPDYMAGFGPQQGDMYTLATAPLGFTQQKAVVRVAQLTTTTQIPPQAGGQIVLVYDTVLEDPYQAWNVDEFYFVPPFTGWYHITATVSIGTCPTNTILGIDGMGAIVPPTSGGVVQGMTYSYYVAGVATYVAFPYVLGTGTVSTSNNPGSTLEIIWAGFSAS